MNATERWNKYQAARFAAYVPECGPSKGNQHVLMHPETNASYSFKVNGAASTVEVQCGRCQPRTLTIEAARLEYRKLTARGFRPW